MEKEIKSRNEVVFKSPAEKCLTNSLSSESSERTFSLLSPQRGLSNNNERRRNRVKTREPKQTNNQNLKL
jgi:hypothetical protein